MITRLKEKMHQANAYYTGWRPALGWIAMAGCLIAFVLYPVADLGDALWRRNPLPPYPMEQLMVLVAYALGKAWIRHKDKEAGVATISTHPYEEAGESKPEAADRQTEYSGQTPLPDLSQYVTYPNLSEDTGAPWKTRS